MFGGTGLRCAPRTTEEPPLRKWAEPYAAGFVLLLVTYLNLSKNPEVWVKAKTMPAVLYGLSADTWFNLAYAALAGVFVALLIVHRRQPLPARRAWREHSWRQSKYSASPWCRYWHFA